VTQIEAEEVGASLKWATAKVERVSQRGNGDRSQGRERHAARLASAAAAGPAHSRPAAGGDHQSMWPTTPVNHSLD
jgi:hypothetical protein